MDESLIQTLQYEIAPPVQVVTSSCRPQGRPELYVDIEQFEMHGFCWYEIADMLGVSVRTLHRRRVEYNLGDIFSFTDITDEEVCRQLQIMKKDFPDIGE